MDEFAGWAGRLRLVRFVWASHPDLLIDLRQTILPLVWRPWQLRRYFRPIPARVTHMRQRHLWRLKIQARMRNAECGMRNDQSKITRSSNNRSIWVAPEDETHVGRLLTRWGLDQHKPLVVICPGARSHIKRWYPDRFALLTDRLVDEAEAEAVFTGEPEEGPIVQEILGLMRHRAHNAIGATTIRQLAALMRRAKLVITNDSASLHLACAMRTPVLALFGPTDPRKYGPTGPHDRVIQRRLFCVPCEQALCRFNHECMRFITVDEVYETAHYMLEVGSPLRDDEHPVTYQTPPISNKPRSL
jgi:lipopolysaccharide heptosyltransferase II